MYKRKDAITDAVFRLSDMAIIGPENTSEWAEYQAWLAKGNVVEAEDPDVPAVPFSVTPLQIRKALRQLGLKTSIDQFVTTLDEEAQEEWEYATVIERNHPMILAAAAALEKTEEDIDNLFRLAGTL